MPHVSKRKLNPDTFNKIFKEFITILGRAQTKGALSSVLNEVLTETEKIMLAKRVATVLSLLSDIPQHRISEALFLSPTTVSKISLKLEIGKFNQLKKISTKEKVDLEKIIWLLLTAGGALPPKVGGKYWRKKGYKYFLQS